MRDPYHRIRMLSVRRCRGSDYRTQHLRMGTGAGRSRRLHAIAAYAQSTRSNDGRAYLDKRVVELEIRVEVKRKPVCRHKKGQFAL